jgi:hypothetical protein
MIRDWIIEKLDKEELASPSARDRHGSHLDQETETTPYSGNPELRF